ncbi:MAG TPA: glycosyltransferase family 2 protein [Opitutus sp.]|nr:glycosyltransferase family 2 protein [Opitutus sp.]
MHKIPVSILIPIRNEEANLPRCLASVAWAEEIIVVDSQSTDRSVAIARRFGAEVVQFNFNGVWPKKKNWALEQVPFRHEWVLILDADEVMPPDAAKEIGDVIAADGHGCTGYWINRRFMFMGRWLKHAYYPNWNLRLFKHALGRYERLVQGATQSGDNEVHEHIIVHGNTGRLHCEMDHYAFASIDVFVEKHNRYSNWEARLELEQGLDHRRSATPQSGHVRLRRILKRTVRRLPFRPSLRFLYVYVFQAGFLDGREGYIFARLHAMYEFLAVAKAAELRKQRSLSQPSESPEASEPTATAADSAGR